MSEPAPAAPPAWPRALACITGRELGALFDSAIAPVTLGAFVLAASTLYLGDFFLLGRLDLTPLFERLPALLVLLAPALSMRLWSEDRRARTFELLVTLPVPGLVLAAGKLLAAWTLVALALLGTLPLVVLLEVLGSPDLGRIAAGYLGALGLGLLLTTLGSLVSALARDQVVAFLASALLAALLVALGRPEVVSVLDGLAPALGAGTWLRETVSAGAPYERLVGGLVDVGALAYLLGGTALLLLLHPLALSEGRT